MASAPGPDLGIPVPRASSPPPSEAPAPENAPSSTKPRATFTIDPSTRFEREHRCEVKLCRFDQGLPETVFATTPLEAVPSKVALWVEQLASHSVVQFPANASLQFVVFVLSGALQFAAHAPEQQGSLSPFDALAVPGANFQLECSSETCQVFVAAIAAEETLSDTLALPSAPPPTPSAVVKGSLSKARECPLAGGAGSSSVVLEGDSDASFNLSWLRVDADRSIPVHAHERGWANLLVLKGSAEASLRGRPYQFGAGQTLQAPPGVRHGFSVRGREPWVVLSLQAPREREPCFMK